MIERKRHATAKVGVFAVAHGTYWAQFEGLEARILGYHADFVRMVEGFGVEVVDLGMIDTNEKGFNAADTFTKAQVDLLFCNMVTYATSSVVAPILAAANVPVVLVALQPRKAMDYTRASTFMQLENDNICSVPEFTGVAIRMGKPVADVVIGTLYDDPEASAEIADWCDVARALHGLKGAKLGLMGHVLDSMYDMHADPTAVSAAFGLHVAPLEPEELVLRYRQTGEEEIQKRMELIRQEFDMPEPKSDPVTMKLTDADLRNAAQGSLALDRLVAEKNLTGLAYYYEGEAGGLTQEVISSLIVGNSMLNAQGIPMCGEFDIKTCVAMLIMDRLGIGGSFAEFHPFDFEEDFILVGHDGPHHLAIADGKPVLRSLKKYHGKPGSGASVEFKLKEGPITMLGITQTFDGKFKFVIGEGESRKGPIPPTGNTNTRGFFAPTTKEFIKKWVTEGPTHHYALGIGHRAKTIQKIANALGIESVIVK